MNVSIEDRPVPIRTQGRYCFAVHLDCDSGSEARRFKPEIEPSGAGIEADQLTHERETAMGAVQN